jgi:hypothetical protein
MARGGAVVALAVVAAAPALGAGGAAAGGTATANATARSHATGPLPGRVIFRGDFETGALDQWDGSQRVADNRITVIRTPRSQGRYAGRFEVRNGDNPIGYGDRAEVQVSSSEQEGQERWYDWRIRFAPGFPSSRGWQVVTQWHSALNGSPPVGLYVHRDQVYLQIWRHDAGGNPIAAPLIPWSGPLRRGTWQRFRMHARWSGDDRRGFVRLFVDGRDVTGLVRTRTLYPGQRNYLKLGYYRQSGIRSPGVVYHDGMTVTRIR